MVDTVRLDACCLEKSTRVCIQAIWLTQLTKDTAILYGNVLNDNATNKSVTLTDTRRSQILDQLGLMITWEEDPE